MVPVLYFPYMLAQGKGLFGEITPCTFFQSDEYCAISVATHEVFILIFFKIYRSTQST